MSHLDALQQRLNPRALKAALLATQRCADAAVPLSTRQAAIIQGAILNTLVDAATIAGHRFAAECVRSQRRLDELEQLDTASLVDLLTDHIWGMMDEGEQSDIVEASIDRLKTLD